MTDVKVPFRPWAITDSNVRNNIQVQRRISAQSSSSPPPVLALLAPPVPIIPLVPPVPLDLSICGPHHQAEKPEAKPKENVTILNGRVNKRMSREKRIQANTRERVRVHEITAAFESLRQSIPSYSNNQKLSKLSILRIACSYINALKEINSCDCNQAAMNSVDNNAIATVTKTIEVEGKMRTNKPNN